MNFFKKHSYIFSAAIFILNVIIKFIFLDSRDIALDEPFSIFHAQETIPDIFNYSGSDINPPFYFILLHYWIGIFGIGAISARFLSVLFSAFTAVLLYKTGERFLNQNTGLIASLLFTFSTLHIYYSHDVRTYSLFAMLNILALYFYLAIISKPQIKINYYLLFLSNFVLIYSHYFAFFVVFIQIIFFFFIPNKKVLWKGLLAISITLFFLYIPHISITAQRFFHTQKHETWIYSAPAATEYYGNLNIFMNSKYCILTLIVIFTFLFLRLLKGKQLVPALNSLSTNLNLKIIFAWFIVPYTLMFLFSFKTPMFSDRYILYTSIPFYLFTASLLYTLADKKIYQITTGGLMISAMIISVNLNPDNNRRIIKATKLVKELKKENSLVIISPDYTDVGFTYHYNSSYFKDYKNTRTLLETENIFPLNTSIAVENILSKRSWENCIYFQADLNLSDPDDLILQAISKKYSKHTIKNIFEIYTIHYFSN